MFQTLFLLNWRESRIQNTRNDRWTRQINVLCYILMKQRTEWNNREPCWSRGIPEGLNKVTFKVKLEAREIMHQFRKGTIQDEARARRALWTHREEGSGGETDCPRVQTWVSGKMSVGHRDWGAAELLAFTTEALVQLRCWGCVEEGRAGRPAVLKGSWPIIQVYSEDKAKEMGWQKAGVRREASLAGHTDKCVNDPQDVLRTNHWWACNDPKVFGLTGKTDYY